MVWHTSKLIMAGGEDWEMVTARSVTKLYEDSEGTTYGTMGRKFQAWLLSLYIGKEASEGVHL